MKVRKRRVAVTVVAGCVMALATLPAVLTGSAPPTPVGFASPGHAAALPASADQFAIQVLDSAPVPPGARPWTAAPPAVLDHGFMDAAVGGAVDLDALYLVDDAGLTGLLDSWVAARLPRGTTGLGYGTFSSPSGQAEGCAFSLPTSGPNQYLAQLDYDTTEAGGGAYLLRIDAEVVWVPDRPGSERVPPPAGAELTGYATLSDMNPSSEPVSVQLGEVDAARLAAVANALPLVPQVACAEGSLLYMITFHPLAGSGPTYSISENVCGSTVSVSRGATRLPALSDAGCSLLRLVVALLPPEAAGTRSAAGYC